MSTHFYIIEYLEYQLKMVNESLGTVRDGCKFEFRVPVAV